MKIKLKRQENGIVFLIIGLLTFFLRYIPLVNTNTKELGRVSISEVSELCSKGISKVLQEKGSTCTVLPITDISLIIIALASLIFGFLYLNKTELGKYKSSILAGIALFLARYLPIFTEDKLSLDTLTTLCNTNIGLFFMKECTWIKPLNIFIIIIAALLVLYGAYNYAQLKKNPKRK